MKVGNLPEERGLYKNFRLLECLTYLGALKGMSRQEASRRAGAKVFRTRLLMYGKRAGVKDLARAFKQA